MGLLVWKPLFTGISRKQMTRPLTRTYSHCYHHPYQISFMRACTCTRVRACKHTHTHTHTLSFNSLSVLCWDLKVSVILIWVGTQSLEQSVDTLHTGGTSLHVHGVLCQTHKLAHPFLVATVTRCYGLHVGCIYLWSRLASSDWDWHWEKGWSFKRDIDNDSWILEGGNFHWKIGNDH